MKKGEFAWADAAWLLMICDALAPNSSLKKFPEILE